MLDDRSKADRINYIIVAESLKKNASAWAITEVYEVVVRKNEVKEQH